MARDGRKKRKHDKGKGGRSGQSGRGDAGGERVMGFCTKKQTRRFERRYEDPLRQWKLSPMDVESWARGWDYTAAFADMFKWTDTAWAPWHVVESDDKKRARLNCIAHLLDLVPYEKVPFDAPEIPKRKPRRKGAPETVPFKTIVPDCYEPKRH